MIPDEGLLNEVAGLAEWPLVLLGSIPQEFMDVPEEILQTSMRTHQKYFSLRDPKSGKMANRFALVANMIAEDGGKEIIAGNERVLRARLSDAKFFWDEDRKVKLADRVDALKGIVFHAKLGTQYERVERIAGLAGEIAGKIGGDAKKAERAARLAKADLTTGVVGEFPELQGVMGRYYALHDGEASDVANAIRDHYKPVGPSDVVPSEKIGIAVALADKIDSLVGFFAVGDRPTGSGDPYALRRAALGVTRIILGNNLRIPLQRTFGLGLDQYLVQENPSVRESFNNAASKFIDLDEQLRANWNFYHGEGVANFISDRLKVALKEKGVRHDLIDAVFALGHEDDLVRLVARVEALQSFLKTDDGANLLAGYKRAANILKAEEKKDNKTYISEVHESLLAALPEKNLYAALEKVKSAIAPALEKEDFAGAMRLMASLRGPVDAFFDGVKVNDENPKLRENRLNLLASLRATLHQVADFSRIEG
ncbi:MAG TPA: glycine--tRNA ligase subunit beta [Rhizomicrobium sp.]|nr:glycine--tRNA ligase subunit beta [Rhizomicrobium sp.]